MDNEKRVTLSGEAADGVTQGAPQPIDPGTGMHDDYWVLSVEERGKGFVRPVRLSYRHERCGGVTTMNQSIAETYAREPSFYGATFCVHCRSHYRVGAEGEFTWCGDSAGGYPSKVGT